MRLKDAAGTARGELLRRRARHAVRPPDGFRGRLRRRNDRADPRRHARQRAGALAGRARRRACSGVAGRARRSYRRTGDRDRTSTIHAHRRHRRVREGGAAGGARGDADVAVHSAKDLPAGHARRAGARRGPRAGRRARRAGRARRLADLPTGGTVGTGSVRRRAQLAALRPDLAFARAARQHPDPAASAPSDFDAVVVAVAALERLGLRRRDRRGARPST